jgi:type IV pilus assembly protein PilC
MPSIDLRNYNRGKVDYSQKKDQVEKNRFLDFLKKDIAFGNAGLADKKKESLYVEISSLLQAGINLKSCLEIISSTQVNEKNNY